MFLIIDHYDSFTYNLYQALAEFGMDVQVIPYDKITLEQIRQMAPEGIILSPGPGRPGGITLEIIRTFRGKIPILGVCLGHQAIGLVFGGKVKSAPEIVHGKECLVFHSRKDLFQGVSLPFKVGRYHSLCVEDVSEELIVDAESPDGTIMAMHHKTDPIFGVQFHPESILTPEGKKIFENFLKVCRAQ